MIPRSLQSRVERSLGRHPIVALLGPRQVGKTTLAKAILRDAARPAAYLDLELPSDANKLQDPELYLGRLPESLVILDEIQRLPGLFPVLRALVDQHRVPGRFLLLGSASPDLLRESSESLAGRIVYHELGPLGIDEVKPIERLWLRGGYPESFLANDEEASSEWRRAFVATYLERDIPQLGIQVPAARLRRFWTMLAHGHGQLWNASRLAASLGLSAPTVRHYLDILEGTFIARVLQPYHANVGKRLTKSPKVYLRDSGILHTLLGLGTMDDLLGHPAVGSSWEGFVLEQILGTAMKGRSPFFYRTAAGAEVDLVLLSGRERPVAVEVKYSAAPSPGKGFWNAYRDLGCERGFVVYPGEEAYPLAEGVEALPVGQIGEI
jgi:predicted AAA+ superfamily ATPase